MIEVIWASSENPELSSKISRWATLKLNPDAQRDMSGCAAMGVYEDGVLKGAAIFHDYDPEAQIIELSLVSTLEGMIPRNALRAMFMYAFQDAKCQMLLARTDIENKKANGILKRLGFKLVKVERLLGRFRDGYLCTLTDDDWKKSNLSKRLM